MSKAKPVAIAVTPPEPETAPETTSPESIQPTSPEAKTENQTENKPATAQAPKSQTSKKLALRKERQGR